MARSAAKGRIVVALMCVLMMVGTYLAVRPLVADLLWTHASATAKEELLSQAEEQGDEAIDALLEEARAYNAELAENGFGAHELTQDETRRYLAQLGGAGTSQVMGAVEIPALGLVEKICFGTSETALMAGLGHCAWSSLPVGGRSTHCVLAGHSGMDERRMLDDAPALSPGDHVYISVLGKTLVYEVDSLETVLPSETESLGIEPGRDLLTLVTCVPYGVNSHRLLVHCERCGHEPAKSQGLGRLASLVVGAPTKTVSWIRVLPVALVLAIITTLAVFLWRQNRRKERSRTHERKVHRRRRGSRCSARLRRRYRRRRRRRKRLA